MTFKFSAKVSIFSIRLALFAFSFSFFFIPLQSFAKTEVWVYTSIYKEFIAAIETEFEKMYPDIDVQVFQAGSEKIQAKVEAELLAKKVQADLLLTSDPFWGYDLKNRDLALQRSGHQAVEINYYSLMVLVSHKNVARDLRVKSFSDLTKPAFKNLIQMGSPLESGTTFSSVAYLKNKYGWSFFEKLRDNKIASQGGSSAVIQKIETGEKKFGIVLLENALAAIKRGSPLEIIYPEDGSIPVPSVQVIMKSSPHPKEAALFADFLLSKGGQNFLRNGYMYTVDTTLPPPDGAEPLKKVTQKSTAWTEKSMQEVGRETKEIKKKFSSLILE